MNQPPIALQLWSVRDDMQRDFAATVRAVGKIGYRGVELAGYGNLDARGAKAALELAGLKVAGMHVGLAALRSNLNAVIDEALLLGSNHITCPSWPAAEFVSAAACVRIGEQLGEIGRAVRARGLTFSYHNHAVELQMFDGRSAFEWMLGAAAPRDLQAEPDVYWLHVGGCAPETFLRAHGARCPLIHLKNERELGGGPVDFQAVFAAIDEIDAVEWLIVEQEAGTMAPLAGVRACLEQMRAWGRT